ncbi:Hypothetical predicted protein [Olea europaea subsp. europaea]|uniref:Transcription factor CYCLOIDEA-like n=1 Tax=Olea europaea subsp. europaea TaxID=158383 RepID=A0A8S0PCI7_OLEEU|nr:Hypothetical predicted protein [Olea europaea subsp. europaea]
MYPSNNNCNFNSISCIDHEISQTYFFDNDINSITKEGHSFSSFFGFPYSPIMQYEYEAVSHQFDDLFHEHNSLTTDENAVPAEINATNMSKAAATDSLKEDCYSKTEQQIPRKRSSKKDRHSKINTAHGPRDRRMRLSLDVAHKFFGLQDMLGFDKASKTVDWLLKNSRSAIRELMQGSCVYKQTCSLSSTSECEVVSGIDDQSAAYESKSTIISKKSDLDKPSCTKEKKKSKVARATVAKESRKQARERARARTSEKNSLRESEPKTANNHSSIRLRTHQLETGEESVTRSSNMNPSYKMLAEVEELSSHGAQILGARYEDNWKASTILNYQHDAASPSHEPQFTDFLFCTKPWDAYGWYNLSG